MWLPACSRVLAIAALLLASAPTSAASGFTACLQPLGRHEARLLAPISRGLAQAYGFRVRTLAPRPLPTSAWYPPRGRYRAQLLLDHLRSEILSAERGCDAVIGLTAVDVSMSKGEHPDWGVFGLSYLGDRVGVLSSFRLGRSADARRLAERAVKVSIHELGHVLGLPHRAEAAHCVMNDARGSVQTVDRSRGALCAGERAEAEAALGFALPRREQLDWDAVLR